MSVATGYKQFLRKYRLLIISKEESTVTFVSETVKTDTNVTGSATQTGKVTGGKVNVRKGPSTRYKSYGMAAGITAAGYTLNQSRHDR